MARSVEPPIVTEADLIGALRTRFAAPEWAFLPHVRDATGGRASRTADAVAMNLWPSRGLALHGFEVKVDRRDWIRELRAPDKAEVMARLCDAWWLAVSDEAIVQPGELPDGWGLLVLNGSGKLRAIREPRLRAERDPIRREFLAALLRRVNETHPVEAVLRAEYARGREDAQAEARADAERRVRFDQSDYEALQAQVRAFEAASGIRISAYSNGKELGRAVRAVLDGERLIGRAEQDVRNLVASLRGLADQVQAVVDGATP